MVEERSSLQSERSAVQRTSAGESVERLRMFGSKTGDRKLRDFMNLEPKWKGGSYVMRAIMPIASVDDWKATVLRCLVRKEKHGGNGRREYDNSYIRNKSLC